LATAQYLILHISFVAGGGYASITFNMYSLNLEVATLLSVFKTLTVASNAINVALLLQKQKNRHIRKWH
jgi:hypothetical protein